jgi:hypothetical protein
MIMFILHARIVLSGNINTCVVYEQHHVPSMPCRRGETTYAMGWLKWGPN